MKKILTIAILLLSSSAMFSQGYTWEWSPRAPQTMPTTFVGIEVTGGYAQHQGDLPYVEKLITCCTFENGTGTPFRIAVFGERWVLPKTALSAGFGVTFQGGTFTSDPIRLVRENNSFLVTEYRMQVQQTQMVLQLGARQRLFNSFLSVGVGVAGLINLGGTADVSHHVLEGDDFATNPPSRDFDRNGIVIDNFTAFNIEPSLSLQYDLELATGMVLSPSFYVSMPLLDVGSNVSWTYFTMGAGLRLSRGL